MRRNVYLAITSAVVALLATAVVLFEAPSDDAATDPYVRGTSANVYCESSSSYSELVYMSDALPTTLNPSEWVRTTDGLWHNFNQSSGDYGNVLTYGQITGVTDDQIREDVAAMYPDIFTKDSFRIIQVDYVVYQSCTFSLKLTHSVYSQTFTVKETMTYAESGITSYSNLYTDYYNSVKVIPVVSQANGSDDVFEVADVHGSYTVKMSCSADTGASKTWSSILDSSDKVQLYGFVYDIDGSPIEGARILYTEGSGSNDSYTDGTGKFTITASYGKSVQVSSVTKDGYTFPTPISPGFNNDPAERNIDVHPVYTAQQHTFIVQVLDQSGSVVENTKVCAYWYYHSSGRIIARDALGATSQVFLTDDEGKVSIMYSTAPATDALLYICLEEETGTPDLNYQVHKMPTVGSSATIPKASQITGISNKGYDPADYLSGSFPGSVTTLEVLDSSITVNVRTGNDSGYLNLANMSVQAVWVFQTVYGEKYIFNYNEETAGATTSGSTCVSESSGDDGNIKVYYVQPEFTPAAGKSVFLLIKGLNNSDPTTIAEDFTFDWYSSLIYTHTYDDTAVASSVDAVASGLKGVVALAWGSVPGSCHVATSEDGYILSATFTGDVPEFDTDSVRVNQQGQVDTMITPSKDASGYMVFSVIVKGDQTITLTITASGYSFSPTKIAPLTSNTHVNIVGTASGTVTTFTREVPVKILVTPSNPDGSVTVSGVVLEEQFRLTYTSGSTSITRNVSSLDTTVAFVPLQFSSGMVSGFNVYASDIVVITNSSISFTIYHMTQKSIVTYNDVPGNVPSVDSVVTNVTIIASLDSSNTWSARTNSEGVATLTVPNISTLTYYYGIHTLDPEEVTDGAFKGYTAFNFYYIDPPVEDEYIEITVRYKAITNVSGEPSSTDIVEKEVKRLKVGDTVTFTAPAVDGLQFQGWTLGGTSVSGSDSKSCTFTVTSNMDDLDLVALYSAYQAPDNSVKIDMTAVAIGMVGIIIAVMAFAVVLTMMKRY